MSIVLIIAANVFYVVDNLVASRVFNKTYLTVIETIFFYTDISDNYDNFMLLNKLTIINTHILLSRSYINNKYSSKSLVCISKLHS